MYFVNLNNQKEFFASSNDETLARLKGCKEWVKVRGVKDNEPEIRVHERTGWGETIYLKSTHEDFEVFNR